MLREPLIMDIPKAKWSALRRKVKAAGNTLVLLVHPYFTEPFPGSEKYLDYLKSLLEKSRFPIIILEEDVKASSLKKKLGKLAKRVLIIPTYPENPYPILNRSTKEYMRNLKGFPELISKKTGVQNILIGGMTANRHSFRDTSSEVLKYESEWLNKYGRRIINADRFKHNSRHHGCAGFTYRAMIESGLFPKIRFIPNVLLDREGILHNYSPYVRPKGAINHREKNSPKPKRK